MSTAENMVTLTSLNSQKMFMNAHFSMPVGGVTYSTQTHQEMAKALVVKHFALVSLSQLFAQFDCLLPHLQKKKSGEQSSHWPSSKRHLRGTGNMGVEPGGLGFCGYSWHASSPGSTKPCYWHHKAAPVSWLLCQGLPSVILFAVTWRTSRVLNKKATVSLKGKALRTSESGVEPVSKPSSGECDRLVGGEGSWCGL